MLPGILSQAVTDSGKSKAGIMEAGVLLPG